MTLGLPGSMQQPLLTSALRVVYKSLRVVPDPRKKKAKASKAGPTSGMRSKVQAALADQASLPRIDNKSFHDVHRAEGCWGRSIHLRWGA